MSSPTFDKTVADQHYKDKYEKPVNIDVNQLKWFPEVNPPTIKYNLSPYTQKDIKHTLYKKCSSSAPCDDGIVYALFDLLYLFPAFTYVYITWTMTRERERERERERFIK